MADVRGGGGIVQALRATENRLKRARHVRVGFLKNASYPDGTPVALVAATNEFGRPSHGQPPRPFFRRMIAEHRGEWPEQVGEMLRDANYDTLVTLEQAGQLIAGELQQSIVDLVEPPLKQSTIDRKGHSKPLVETGHMLRSVDYQVDRT